MNKLFILPLLLVLSITFALGATCTYYVTADSSTGADYFHVNTVTTNITVFGADQLFLSYDYFTPRLNFSAQVNETITGGESGDFTWLSWKTWDVDIAPTFSLYEATNLTNEINWTRDYSLWYNNDSTYYIWAVQWNTTVYNNTLMVVVYNRTFVKNTDDFILTPEYIYGNEVSGGTVNATTTNFLTFTGGTDYGVNKTFLLSGYGVAANDSNWAVGWTLRTRVCTSYAIDEATHSGIGGTKKLVFAGLALLAVMILVTVAWGLIQLFQGGQADFMAITIVAIGGAVLIMLGYIIIYFVATALGG